MRAMVAEGIRFRVNFNVAVEVLGVGIRLGLN